MFFSFWITMRLEANPAFDDGLVYQPPLCDNDSRWIFALLTRLDQELTSEQISTLRILARGCLSLLVGSLKAKKRFEPPEDPLIEAGRASCWMVILAIVSVWGQRDLWEEAESAVAGACS